MYVCTQKNERLTHLLMRIFLLVLFPDFHVVVFFFIALSSCAVLFFNFFMGIKVAFLIPPPHTFVTHDETNQVKRNNQAMNKLKQIEQCVLYKTNEGMCRKLDRSYNM